MNGSWSEDSPTATTELMLGDEAVALGAVHAGLSAAYAYPGTPSTEIFERVIAEARRAEGVVAQWAANEKAAFEAALGASLAGKRALVTLKHVGLNVAADPFINSALLRLGGGLVLAVADDPGMHSSQNEQDSRFYADFARVPCLEPATAQEAYEMTRAAFDLSERFHVPVVVRLVTRLCHERAAVIPEPAVAQRPVNRAGPRADWVLLPANSRRLWRGLLAKQSDIRSWCERSEYNLLTAGLGRFGVVTTGIARRYLREVLPALPFAPPHLHIATYPLPETLLQEFVEGLDKVLVLEDGQPFVERALRGVMPTDCEIEGRLTGAVPPTGELNPSTVGEALGLPAPPAPPPLHIALPARPPQLCQGCAHRDAYGALERAIAGLPDAIVAGDIGCYTLGALPPYAALDSTVCMGASIGMAKGASDAGLRPAIAVIGDSTFLHSGIPPLIDAAAHDTDMTVLILDNQTVAMTGQQPTALPDSRLVPLVTGLGVPPEHVLLVHAHPRAVEDIAATIRREIEHPGLSVIVLVRECIVAARARRRS